jgi:molecular chaperone DnaK
MNKNGDEILVGEPARSRVDLPGCGCREFKREMGKGRTFMLMDRTFTPQELSAHVLKKLITNAEEATGAQISEAVISVPANFDDAAKAATHAAAVQAGLKLARTIHEPTAAALAFGVRNMDLEEQLVVFDFGGGTLDVTVLEMINGVIDVKCSYGDPQLGGKDFDAVLQELFLQRFKKEHPNAEITEEARNGLKSFAENAKINLSTQRTFEDRLRAFGSDRGAIIDLEVEVSRQELQSLAAPLLKRAKVVLEKALKAKDITPEKVDRVLLVGGTTYMPCVRELVAEFFGKEPRADVQPDLAVAMGASIQAALARGLISGDKGIILTDVCPYGLGVDVLSMVGGRPMIVYDELIPPNSTIPLSVTREYSLLSEDQDGVIIRVYQDHEGTAKLPQDALDTGIEARIKDIPRSKTGMPHPLEVEFEYDVSGLVRLKAGIKATGQKVEVTFNHSDLRMDQTEIEQARDRVDELWKRSSRSKRYQAMIGRAEKLINQIDGDRKELLESTVRKLKQAMTRNDQTNIERAADRLVELMYDIQSKG